VRIDSESLPTGMAMPSAGHSSMATARTRVVQRSVLARARRRRPSSWQTELDVRASASDIGQQGCWSAPRHRHAARRPAASSNASGERSPIAIASPAMAEVKSARVTAQSATGTCQGPTMGSR
jgi:hypothetical protein